jgi:hypothetical protein
VLDALPDWPGWLSLSLKIAAVAAGLYLVHLLLNWLTRDRPKDYSRRGSAGLGNALLEVHAMLEPDRANLREARLEERVEEERSGDPPSV